MSTSVAFQKIMWYGAQIAEAIQDYGPDYGLTSDNQLNLILGHFEENREAYIDRARHSYHNSFIRNGVEVIGRSCQIHRPQCS